MCDFLLDFIHNMCFIYTLSAHYWSARLNIVKYSNSFFLFITLECLFLLYKIILQQIALRIEGYVMYGGGVCLKTKFVLQVT